MLAAPNIDFSQSRTINSTAVFLQWSPVPGAAGYSIVIDVMTGAGGGVVRVGVEFVPVNQLNTCVYTHVQYSHKMVIYIQFVY